MIFGSAGRIYRLPPHFRISWKEPYGGWANGGEAHFREYRAAYQLRGVWLGSVTRASLGGS